MTFELQGANTPGPG